MVDFNKMRKMKLTPVQKSIFAGKICPYCKGTTKTVSQEFIYGRKFTGRAIICCSNFPHCDSFVGTHDDGTALGRLANNQLRNAKKEAHKYFDKLWHLGLMSRSECYEWLQDELGIPDEYCHIGMFSVKTCEKVRTLSIELRDKME